MNTYRYSVICKVIHVNDNRISVSWKKKRSLLSSKSSTEVGQALDRFDSFPTYIMLKDEEQCTFHKIFNGKISLISIANWRDAQSKKSQAKKRYAWLEVGRAREKPNKSGSTQVSNHRFLEKPFKYIQRSSFPSASYDFYSVSSLTFSILGPSQYPILCYHDHFLLRLVHYYDILVYWTAQHVRSTWTYLKFSNGIRLDAYSFYGKICIIYICGEAHICCKTTDVHLCRYIYFSVIYYVL